MCAAFIGNEILSQPTFHSQQGPNSDDEEGLEEQDNDQVVSHVLRLQMQKLQVTALTVF